MASLCYAKRLGLTFDRAWSEATRAFGKPRDTADAGLSPQLFAVEGEDYAELPRSECFREYCWDAWHGEKPGLRGFTLDMLYGPDSSQPALVSGVIKQAA